jgi:hypothetical protein
MRTEPTANVQPVELKINPATEFIDSISSRRCVMLMLEDNAGFAVVKPE